MKKPNSILQFMGMGMQMMATIALGAYIGHYFDVEKNNHPAILTLVGMFTGVIISMIFFLKQLTALNKDKDDSKKLH